MEFFNSAKFFNNAKNQLEFTKETRFARYQSKFSLIFGIKKKFCFVEKIFHFLSVVHTTNTHWTSKNLARGGTFFHVAKIDIFPYLNQFKICTVIWRKWQTLCCRLEWDEKRDFLRMVKRLRDDCSNAVRQDGLHLAPNLVNVPLL